jgi:hypothetical protein
MRSFRFLPFFLTGAGVCLLARALSSSVTKRPSQLPQPPAELRRLCDAGPDAGAGDAVEQALARLGEPGRQWLQSAVWLRSHVPGLAYEGRGVYLKAPGGRYRLEARTRRGRSTDAVFLAVSDGRDRWQAMRNGSGGYRDVRRLRAGEAAPPGQMVAGADALLRSLHAHLKWVRRELKGRDVVVTGVWQPALREALAPPKSPWPANLPRACRLALRDGWPGRVEWWGPAAEGGEDRLLMELEFRDPVWGRRLSEEECDRLFAFDPGAGKGTGSAP